MSPSNTTSRQHRPAFTLIEMTIVIAIIAILSAMAMSVYATAAQQARGMRTRAIIAKIDQLIGEKYESYRTRQAPVRINPLTTPPQAAAYRLNAIRELMRMELPDSKSDVVPFDGGNPVILIAANGASAPSLWKQLDRNKWKRGMPLFDLGRDARRR
ncbi:MAG: prepilin-type N-terminal cleavage/methylation domain-containing protein [Planctomycetales bacterium]|nr:prepilin-type N-terminal cleavage/methylation domain-containing protein [Planctomycetales bacterium]